MARTTNMDPDSVGVRLGNAADVKASRRSRTKGGVGKKREAPVKRRLQAQIRRGTVAKTKSSTKRTESRTRTDAPAIRFRQLVLVLALAVVACVLVARSAQLQLMDRSRFEGAALAQARHVVELRGRRGPIVDRHGAELAMSLDVETVVADPAQVKDPDASARRLAPILRVDRSKLAKKLSSGRRFVYLRRRVSPRIATSIRAASEPGVFMISEPKRFYGGNRLAAHLLGFSNIDGAGRAGLERRYDAALRGRHARLDGLRDGRGNAVLVDGAEAAQDLDGRGLRLSLDRTVQHDTEVALAKAVRWQRARSGVAIVLDAQTSEVVAMASQPDFNPNDLGDSTASERRNRAVEMVYEPGSTFKIVTVAAALEEGVASPERRLDCESGKWRFGGRTIRDADHAYGDLTVAESLSVSSNICAAKLGIELGRDRLHRWIQRFGLTRATGIELPAEARGLLRSPRSWRDIALANISFGQGIAVTPLQMAQALNVIAAGGIRRAPRIVAATELEQGHWVEAPKLRSERVLRPETATALTRMMVGVVEEGTGQQAAIPGFQVAGKTGTAQKIDPLTRAYSREDYVASFGGFGPAEAPEFTVLVVLDEPQGSIYGGIAAAPAFRQILSAALRARGHVVSEPKTAPAPGTEASARTELVPKGAPGEAPEPRGLEFALSDQAKAMLGLNESLPSSDPGVVPGLVGLGAHEVLERCEKAGCVPIFVGTGRVVEQTPASGTAMVPGATWQVRMKPRFD
ncbi:MAG: penicillin-binding transpeptidase domain-containing protein [Myxococcota bacterium]